MSEKIDWSNLEAEWAGVRMQFEPASSPLFPQSEIRNSGIVLPGPISHVLIAILHEQRFLLTRIAGRGYCIPSGHVEPGENSEQAARREAYEEAGAQIRDLRLLGHYRLYPAGIDARQSESISYASLYLAELASLKPLPPGSESQGVRWASLEALPGLYYQWSPLIEAVFNYVLEKAYENR